MIFKREKVKFTYKDGFTTVTFKNVSDKHLNILKRDICREQIRRKEAELFGNTEQVSFGKKLRRFIRRISSEIQYHAETTAVNHIVGYEQAADMPYINLIDETAG